MELFTFDRCIEEEEIYDFEKKYFDKTKFNDLCCGKNCFISKYNAYYVKDNQLIDINSGVVCDDYEYLRIILEKLYVEKVVLYKGEKHFNEILELLKELYAQKYKAPNIEEVKKKIKSIVGDFEFQCSKSGHWEWINIFKNKKEIFSAVFDNFIKMELIRKIELGEKRFDKNGNIFYEIINGEEIEELLENLDEIKEDKLLECLTNKLKCDIFQVLVFDKNGEKIFESGFYRDREKAFENYFKIVNEYENSYIVLKMYVFGENYPFLVKSQFTIKDKNFLCYEFNLAEKDKRRKS